MIKKSVKEQTLNIIEDMLKLFDDEKVKRQKEHYSSSIKAALSACKIAGGLYLKKTARIVKDEKGKEIEIKEKKFIPW